MNVQEYGTPYYASGTSLVCITSANAQIIGILFQASATQACQLWAGTTATATTAGVPLGGVIRGYSTTGAATTQPATWFPFPAYCSGGICLNLPDCGDPKLTLFWNPTGGA